MILIAIEFFENEITHQDEHDRACRLRDELLSKYCKNVEFKFKNQSNGKPYIADSQITYSITHTAGCVACAVSVDNSADDIMLLPDTVISGGIYKIDREYPCEIGIDIELADRQRSHDRIDAIATRYFSEGEQTRLSLADDKSLEFYSIWTGKESYVKCTGEGMTAISRTDTTSLSDSFDICNTVLLNNGIQFAGSVCIKKQTDFPICC